MNNNELETIYESGIFVESNESIGILYDSYKRIPDVINAFLVDVEDSVNKLIKNPEGEKIELADKIRQFKSDITLDPVAGEIDINNIKGIQRTLALTEIEMDRVLRKLASFKNKVSFGGNYVRAILKRPKVYIKDVDNEKYQIVNSNIRSVNLALDWVEKITIDMYNLISQDKNILMIVKRVYADKNIYESAGVEAEPVVIEESYGFDLSYDGDILESIIID